MAAVARRRQHETRAGNLVLNPPPDTFEDVDPIIRRLVAGELLQRVCSPEPYKTNALTFRARAAQPLRPSPSWHGWRGKTRPWTRAELTEQNLAVATLVGRYIERREAGQPPCTHDLFTVAAEFGDTAVDALHTVLACYEAMRATEGLAL